MRGDIFQVVLSNRLEAECEGSLLDTYRLLRVINPSPYMFYFSSDDIEIAGSSPETPGQAHRRHPVHLPAGGHPPPGQDAGGGHGAGAGLLADPKERSEHNMLVDLGRNDLGKISRFGTVEVEQYMQVLRYSHVMHLGSTVTGQIRP